LFENFSDGGADLGDADGAERIRASAQAAGDARGAGAGGSFALQYRPQAILYLPPEMPDPREANFRMPR
jgi:hypothetical protein